MSYYADLMKPGRKLEYVVYCVESTSLKMAYARKYDANRLAAKMNEKEARHGARVHFAVAERMEYEFEVVHWVERQNMMSGRKFFEPSNTPIYCSPASESYWSA